MHLSKPIDHTTQTVSPDVCRLRKKLGGQGFQERSQTVTRESNCITNV